MEKKKKKKDNNLKENGLNNVANTLQRDSFMSNMSMFINSDVNNPMSMCYNTRYYLLTLQYGLLTEKYTTDGIYKTLVQQPILDGMRGELEIDTEELSIEEIEELKEELEKKEIYEVVKNAFFWNRLYGGAGIIIEVEGQKTEEPLTFDKIKEGDKINFFSVCRWELSGDRRQGTTTTAITFEKNVFFNNLEINKDRIILLKGERAPYWVNQQLSGWGLSCLEPLIAPANMYSKAVNLMYEMLDEAKMDVIKIDGLNDSLIAGQDSLVVNKIELVNKIKNYQSAIVMDNQDDYSSKQLSFAGLTDLLRELKLDICSAMKMPMTKIFGLSASGFNSGIDDIKNYNAMVESEVRSQIYIVLKKIIKILCKSLFGIIPHDLKIAYPSLEQMDDQQVADIKTKEFAIAQAMLDNKTLNFKEYFDYLKQKDIYTGHAEKSGSNEYKEYDGNLSGLEKDKLDFEV